MLRFLAIGSHSVEKFSRFFMVLFLPFFAIYLQMPILVCSFTGMRYSRTIEYNGFYVWFVKVTGEYSVKVLNKIACETEDEVLYALFSEELTQKQIDSSRSSLLKACMPFADGSIFFSKEPWVKKYVTFKFD